MIGNRADLPSRDRARLGMTLIEALIAATLFAGVLTSIAFVASSSNKAYRTGASYAGLEERVGQTLERVLEELRTASPETLVPDPVAPLGGSSIEYRRALDLAGSEVVWSERRRLAFEYETGEIDDGIDNNGNGVADEGVLVLTENVGTADERSIVLVHWVREHQQGETFNGLDDDGNGLVDEAGFFVVRNGETLDIYLTLERPDGQGAVLTRSAHTAIRLRN